jgi:hypothetical protein
LDGQFRSKLAKCIAIIKPINKLIVKYQCDSRKLSEVYFDMDCLAAKYTDMEGIDAESLAYIRALVLYRWNFMYADAHGVAFLLDPTFFLEHYRVLPDDMLKLEEYVCESPVSDTSGKNDMTRKLALMKELTAFQTFVRRHFTVKDLFYEWLTREEDPMGPVAYWEKFGHKWPLLQKIALNIFALVATSAASERNFSTLAFIHSKLRNRLSNVKVLLTSILFVLKAVLIDVCILSQVEKLAYIRTNYELVQSEKEALEEENFGMDMDEQEDEDWVDEDGDVEVDGHVAELRDETLDGYMGALQGSLGDDSEDDEDEE